MKNRAADTDGPGGVQPSGVDGRTREAVARLLMERGPVAAAEVAEVLGLSGPAVRRHLDALIADGEARVAQAPRRGPRGRGRPARHYTLTDTGRARFGHGYDDLALDALRYLDESGGEAALRMFAQRRVRELIGPGAELSGSVDARVDALAGVLTARGYAAQTRAAGSGVQLCQHHCPVARVAAEFPELCEAETKAFAEVLGTHVQRLATIARGDAACTTHVPLLPAPDQRTRGPDEFPSSPPPPETARSPIGRQSE